MRFIYRAIALIFILFAVVQYNDPDPVQWMLIYGGVGLSALLMSINKPVKWLMWPVFLISVLWCCSMILYFFDWINMGFPSIITTMKVEQPWVEVTREFLGLFLASWASGWLLWKQNTSE